jgi:rhamnosyltransferase subunit B
MPAAPKILIATLGSYGDLFPFVALGLALQREGFAVVIVTSAAHRERVEGEGLGFAPLRPDVDDVTSSLGLDLAGVARAMSTDDGFLFQRIIFPFLRETYADVCAAAEGAVAIVAHAIVFAAHAAAEKLGLPLFITHLSPVLHYLPQDPPQGGSSPFVAAPRGRLALQYNRALLGAYAELAYFWAAPLRRLRRELGLPKRAPFAFFREAAPGFERLALHSPHLLRGSVSGPIAGQTFFDRGPSQAPAEAKALEEFLARGPAPIVFTLGSFVVQDRAAHHRLCIEAAMRLSKRAVVLAHGDDVARLQENLPESIFVASYAPHGNLFPRARVIVHHGGIGTSGQALRAGKPQLVTPFLGDQPDNAARLARLGVARVLPGRAMSVERLMGELEALLEHPEYAERAKEIGASVAQEDGAAVAARQVVAAIGKGATRKTEAWPG